jgi:hypothetical protein
MRKLTGFFASDGCILTDGKTFEKRFFVSDENAAANIKELTIDEYKNIIADKNVNEDDLKNALGAFGVNCEELTKEGLNEQTQSAITETQEALNIIYSALSKDKKEKAHKNKHVKNILDRFGIDYGG